MAKPVLVQCAIDHVPQIENGSIRFVPYVRLRNIAVFGLFFFGAAVTLAAASGCARFLSVGFAGNYVREIVVAATSCWIIFESWRVIYGVECLSVEKIEIFDMVVTIECVGITGHKKTVVLRGEICLSVVLDNIQNIESPMLWRYRQKHIVCLVCDGRVVAMCAFSSIDKAVLICEEVSRGCSVSVYPNKIGIGAYRFVGR